MIKPQDKPNLQNVASQIRATVRSEDCKLKLSDHSEEKMILNAIDFADVVGVLKACKVTNQEWVEGEWRFTAKGRDVDGDEIVLIVVFDQKEKLIELITAWKIRK